MEIRQLAYFMAITEAGSMSRAATIVGVTQSALSRQIAALEDELRVRLFYRHGRGVKLTREGEQFEAVVGPMVRDLMQVTSELRDGADVPAGSISIGMPPSMSAAIGAEIVTDFMRRFPRVKLHLVDGFSGFINEWLAAGRLDMAVVNNARRSPYIRMDYLMTVDLFLFGRTSDIEDVSPDSDSFPLADLPTLPLLLVGQNHGLRRALDEAVRRKGLKLDIRAEVDALAPLKKLVAHGHGFTVLPHGVIFPEAASADFAYRRIISPTLGQDYMLAFSLQKPTTLAMRELARSIRSEIGRALGDGRLIGHLGGLVARSGASDYEYPIQESYNEA